MCREDDFVYETVFKHIRGRKQAVNKIFWVAFGVATADLRRQIGLPDLAEGAL